MNKLKIIPLTPFGKGGFPLLKKISYVISGNEINRQSKMKDNEQIKNNPPNSP
jgi:hypothetical protein